MEFKIHFSGRYLVPFFIVLMILPVLSMAPHLFDDFEKDLHVNGLDSVDPIRIESNTELYYHPEIDSGKGTVTEPFVISDVSIDCRSNGKSGIYLRNTTYNLEIRNVTIYASSLSPAIYLRPYYSGTAYYSLNLKLINITVIGGGTQLDMFYPIRVYISGCNFSNPGGTGDLIHSYLGYYVDIYKNTFNAPNMDIDFDGTYYLDLTRNKGSIRDLVQNRFQYSDISNNTLDVRTVKLYAGYYSDFQGNILHGHSSSDDITWLYDCNRIKIANNSFSGGRDAIVVQHPNTYNPVRTSYESWSSLTFEFNLFNQTGKRGIYFYWTTGHPYNTYMDIHHNRFIGCTDFAIELSNGGSATSNVYRNVFMYNHGSGMDFSLSNSQARDGYSQFRWRRSNVGNFWLDWDNSDDNSDGFSDETGYKLSSNTGQTDPSPVSNQYFDFNRPQFQVLTPTTRFLDTRYVNFTWDASDNETGISIVQIKKGIDPWINISGRDHHGLYLTDGQFQIVLRAVDMAGLKTSISLTIVIEEGVEPVKVLSPIAGRFYNKGNVDVIWELEDGFVPKSLFYQLDGGSWVEKDPYLGFDLDLDDGSHDLRMEFTDHYNNSVQRSITFTIDTRDPEIEILYPMESSVISNGLVNFEWNIDDLTEMRSTNVTIDGEKITGIVGKTHTSFLSRNWHSFSVEVYDMAGNRATSAITFRISENTSLHIISPRLSIPTQETSFLIEWEYLTHLEIENIQISLDENSPVSLPMDLSSYMVSFSEDGLHTVTVEARDPAGNIFSDSVDIIVDRKPPSTRFIGIESGTLINTTKVTLQWGALEESGITGYDLFIDDVNVALGVKDTERTVTLQEGNHILQVLAHDIAGNIGEDQIELIIDITPPQLDLISPLDEVIIEPTITFEWEGNDVNGIVNYNYSLDGNGPFGLGLSTSRELQVLEGQHIFILRCMDNAGNARTIKKTFMVDLYPPEVTLTNIKDGYTNTWSGVLEWSITESMGIDTLILNIDGVDTPLSNETRHQMVDLDDGLHTISITVTDIGGWMTNESVHFVLDRVDPKITPGDVEVKGNVVSIFWILDGGEGELKISVEMDGVEITGQHDRTTGISVFREVTPGKHSMNLTFTDLAGNFKVLTFDLEVKGNDKGKEDTGGVGPIIILVPILILLTVIGVILFIWARGRKKDDKKEENGAKLPSKPERISIGPMPARRQQPLAPARVPSAPQVRSRTTSIGEQDDSYIRPERKKTPPPKNRMQTVPDRPMRATDVSENDDDIEDWSDMEELEEFDELEEI